MAEGRSRTCVWVETCVPARARAPCLSGSSIVVAASACSTSLAANRPYVTLQTPMQNTSIIDAVIKWRFNLACLWLEGKQPIHLTNEVISAIGWPCRFTYGHYTVCEALSELRWPYHGEGWESDWIRWIGNTSNPNLVWPRLKSVKTRHTIDRWGHLYAVLTHFAWHYIKPDPECFSFVLAQDKIRFRSS